MWCVAITNDNLFAVSCSKDKNIIVWNLVKKQIEALFKGHTESVYGVMVSNDDKYIVSRSDDGSVRIWNLVEKRQETMLQSKLGNAIKADITSNCHFVVIGFTHKVLTVCRLVDNKVELSINNIDNNRFNSFLSRNANKIYLSNGIGIAKLDIKKRSMKIKRLFDNKFKNIFKDSFFLEDRIFPKITYSRS